MRSRLLVGSVVSGIVLMGSLAWGMSKLDDYETAPYKVIESDGKIEIREYPDLVLAATASRLSARGNDGSFMRLFRYISGNNQASQKIAMTTPVFMEEENGESRGQMGFVLPRDVVEAGAPLPRAEDVAIRTRVGGQFAVIRFSGVMNERLSEEQEAKLRSWMEARGLQGEATSERAGYDAPFTPGPLRRNEILIRLKPTATPDNSPAATAGEVK